MSRPEPFDQILEVLTTAKHCAVGDFLMDFSRMTGRSECHWKTLGAFFQRTAALCDRKRPGLGLA